MQLKLKQLGVTLALAGMLSTQAYAHEAATEAAPLAAAAAQAAPANVLTQDDLVALFGAQEAGKPLQLALLSEQEMRETEGAWLNFAIGGAVGFGFYAASNWYNNRPITWQGSLYSIGTGALTGGVGGALIRASGGGVAGNVAWRPNILASNFGFSQYRSYRGW
jgi:hypothetical protein